MMKASQVREALARCVNPFRFARLGGIHRNALGNTLGREVVSMHLVWMAQKALEHLDDGRVEKVHRWLGFIQGAS